MEYLPWIIIFILIVILAWMARTLAVVQQKLEAASGEPESIKLMLEWMKDLKNSAESSRSGMERNMLETSRQMNERLDNAAKYISDLQRRVGEVSQIGPDIRRLSEVLASPKARGNFGEELLELMLAEILPMSSYQAQYRFNNGEVVDMIVRVGEKVLPIDSKFSMENFRLFREAQDDTVAEGLRKSFFKDVKKRIDEIHKKYILPSEGTFDFALMYVPSDAVFSEAIADAGVVTYARDKKVYLVSPNTLHHHLQIILLALRGQQMNSAAEKILALVSGIKQESEKFGRQLGVLANHIKNAGNSMGSVQTDFGKLQITINQAAQLELGRDVATAEPAVIPVVVETINTYENT